MLHGYAKSLKTLNISEAVNRHKCLILLDSCRIHATRCLRAHYPAGSSSAPHSHPNQRVVTVLSGRYHQGFGPVFDKGQSRLVEPGGVVVIPANTPHFGWAETDAMVQEDGIGPTGTTSLSR